MGFFQRGTSKWHAIVFKISISATMINLYPHSQHRAEAAIKRCLIALLKILQNSQGNTCVEVSFNKVAAFQPVIFEKGFSCEF